MNTKQEQLINWDKVPEILSKEQFYKLCHISKSTALHLLRNGIVPCIDSGMKTRCYKIKKADVKEYAHLDYSSKVTSAQAMEKVLPLPAGFNTNGWNGVVSL